MTWWKRYEPLLERKAVPIKEALVDLLAKELVEICEAFPPAPHEVAFESEAARRRFEPALPSMPKVDLAFAELLATLVTLDLEHEHEAIDHLFRNGGHREATRTPEGELALHFLWPLVVEVLYSRKEEAQSVLTRRDLVEVVARFRERFRARRMALM